MWTVGLEPTPLAGLRCYQSPESGRPEHSGIAAIRSPRCIVRLTPVRGHKWRWEILPPREVSGGGGTLHCTHLVLCDIGPPGVEGHQEPGRHDQGKGSNADSSDPGRQGAPDRGRCQGGTSEYCDLGHTHDKVTLAQAIMQANQGDLTTKTTTTRHLYRPPISASHVATCIPPPPPPCPPASVSRLPITQTYTWESML